MSEPEPQLMALKGMVECFAYRRRVAAAQRRPPESPRLHRTQTLSAVDEIFPTPKVRGDRANSENKLRLP